MDFILSIRDYLLIIFFLVFTVLSPGLAIAKIIFTVDFLNEIAEYFPVSSRIFIKKYFIYLFAPALGLFLLDALILTLGKLGVALTFPPIVLSFALVNILLWAIEKRFLKSSVNNLPLKVGAKTRRILFLFVLIWTLSVAIRTIYYMPDVLAQDTDLGHHMYWSQSLIKEENIPQYDTSEVIVGEHLIFSVISILSGVNLLSAMPLIIISLFNLLTIFTLSFLALLVSGNRFTAINTLLLIGIYYAIDPPQARFVNGGVIGNTIGNYIILLIFALAVQFYSVWSSRFLSNLSEKKTKLINLSSPILLAIILLLAGLFYTHHLSTFLLLISILFFLLLLLFLYPLINRNWLRYSKEVAIFIKRIILTPQIIIGLLIVTALPALIYIPHYLSSSAISEVAREPLKDTHLGVPLSSLPGKIGWIKLMLAAIGIIYTLITLKKLIARIKDKSKLNLASANGLLIITVWLLPLSILSFYPQIFYIDLPSRRVVNYLVFPLTILAAIGMTQAILEIRRRKLRYSKIILGIFLLLVIIEGTTDFRSTFSWQNKFQETVELYKASEYLAQKTDENSLMLKDHSSIAGDSWIKFFLLRGYDYFISRTYDYKYVNLDPRNLVDACPREMIIVPESSISSECYRQTRINYVILKPEGDEFLFWKAQNFNPVYLSDSIAVFKVDTNTFKQ